jgi:hypothetical protein
MVLLVRCSNNTYSVALKSRLHHLVNKGLVTAFFRNGEWIAVEKNCALTIARPPKRKSVPLSASI